MLANSRLIHMYTIYQFIIAIIVYIFPKLFNQSITDVIRASCLITAMIILYYYTVFGFKRFVRVYDNLWPGIDKRLFPFSEIITHFGIIYLVGLPKKPESILYATCIIILWTNLLKNKLNDIYELPII